MSPRNDQTPPAPLLQRGECIVIARIRSNGRGRDAGYPTPPAQIPASGTTAQGSCLGFITRIAPAGMDAPATDAVYIALQNVQIAPMPSCPARCVGAIV